jgi:glycosyltransferase involved in cell wall biosynthesis
MDDLYDFCVIITTYNRPDMLYKLLENISEQKKDYKILVTVFDDGSTVKYDVSKYNVKKIGMAPNMGKQKYYIVFNSTFSYIKNINSKYYVYLPDDIQLVNNFFDETKRIYESITDHNKICLSLLTDGRVHRTNWVNFKTVDRGEYYQTQWNDLCFICEKKFFEVLNYRLDEIPKSRWKNNPNLSSGVGQQITLRLFNLGYGMYHTKTSMVIHGSHESKMNKVERINTKLETL